MKKLPISEYELDYHKSFPVYWKATDEDLRSTMYDSDACDDAEEYYCILTFEDIEKDFNSWTPAQRAEYLGDSNTPDYNVYDLIRDCMMNSLQAISGYHRKGE